MSVILKGMEMPDRCGLCPCFHPEHPMYCQAVKADKEKRIYAPYGKPRPDWCPLIEIPEGARLIDAKGLLDKLHAHNRKAFTKHDVWLMLMPYGSETVFEED